MKSSITSRSLKLLGLAAKVGQKELFQNLKENLRAPNFMADAARTVDDLTSGRLQTRVAQAKLIAESLAQLKGAAMKAGQLLSIDSLDLFPPEALEILSKLQKQAEPAEWQELYQVLQQELGAEGLREFSYIQESAAASASIGQVHRGRLANGEREVAIKVQYPGVVDSIDSDLSILQTIAQSFMRLTGRQMDLTEIFGELNSVLRQESDYEIELANMREFGEHLKNHPGYAAPEPIERLSTKRVLTMSWLDGENLNDWLKTSPSLEARTRLATLALDLYCLEFFEWGLVQTDPNFANFLVIDGGQRLGVLDFGATLRYSPEFRLQYGKLLRALDSSETERILEELKWFSALDPRESEEAKGHLIQLLTLAIEPFKTKRQPFYFRDHDFTARSLQAGRTLGQSLKHSPPPRKLIFLHRKLGGIFSLMKRLDVTIDLAPYWARMVQR